MKNEKSDYASSIPEGADMRDPRVRAHEDLLSLIALKENITQENAGALPVEADLLLPQAIDSAVEVTKEVIALKDHTQEELDVLENKLSDLWLNIVRLARKRNIQIENNEWLEGLTDKHFVVSPDKHTLQ